MLGWAGNCWAAFEWLAGAGWASGYTNCRGLFEPVLLLWPGLADRRLGLGLGLLDLGLGWAGWLPAGWRGLELGPCLFAHGE